VPEAANAKLHRHAEFDNDADHFGISAPGISQATLTDDPTYTDWNYIFIDNFTTVGGNAVSAPDTGRTALLLIMGLGALLAAANRRHAFFSRRQTFYLQQCFKSRGSFRGVLLFRPPAHERFWDGRAVCPLWPPNDDTIVAVACVNLASSSFLSHQCSASFSPWSSPGH
jgi:hypothetical protein